MRPTSFPSNSPTKPPLLVVVLFVAGCVLSGGCLHPNIPSVRYGAGSQGSPNPDVGEFDAVMAGQPARFAAPGGACGSEGFLSNPECEARRADVPEVPWPRFHPLPTEPVF